MPHHSAITNVWSRATERGGGNLPRAPILLGAPTWETAQNWAMLWLNVVTVLGAHVHIIFWNWGPCQVSALAVSAIWRYNLQDLLNTKYSTAWINLREIHPKIRFWNNIHYKQARTALQILVDHAITSRQFHCIDMSCHSQNMAWFWKWPEKTSSRLARSNKVHV